MDCEPEIKLPHFFLYIQEEVIHNAIIKKFKRYSVFNVSHLENARQIIYSCEPAIGGSYFVVVVFFFFLKNI